MFKQRFKHDFKHRFVIMAGFADWLFVTLGGRMGFTFSQGFIDFFLFYRLGTKVLLLLGGKLHLLVGSNAE